MIFTTARKGLEIFIHRKPIDMRFGFHKLTGLIRSEHGMQTLLDGHVFIFFGNNRTRLKVFFFDGTGVCLLIKRLEQGRFMWIGDVDFDKVNFKELEQLMHGSKIVRAKFSVMQKK